jgi:hypothetical protein
LRGGGSFVRAWGRFELENKAFVGSFASEDEAPQPIFS